MCGTRGGAQWRGGPVCGVGVFDRGSWVVVVDDAIVGGEAVLMGERAGRGRGCVRGVLRGGTRAGGDRVWWPCAWWW